MLDTLKAAMRVAGLDTRELYQAVSAASVRAAIKEQGLCSAVERLRQVLPDVTDQFTRGFDEGEFQRYWEVKMRGIHAFQVDCILDALKQVKGENLTLADIGDSAGNHAAYIKALAPPH